VISVGLSFTVSLSSTYCASIHGIKGQSIFAETALESQRITRNHVKPVMCPEVSISINIRAG